MKINPSKTPGQGNIAHVPVPSPSHKNERNSVAIKKNPPHTGHPPKTSHE